MCESSDRVLADYIKHAKEEAELSKAQNEKEKNDAETQKIRDDIVDDMRKK